jgi:hypothetical protein
MTKNSTSEQVRSRLKTEMSEEEFTEFERIACAGIYEMVSTLRGLPPADGLDETDVRTAVACACLRIAACEISNIPWAEVSPFVTFLKGQFARLRSSERVQDRPRREWRQ